MAVCKRGVITLGSVTGLPENDCVNVLHFAPDDSDNNIVNACIALYNDDAGGAAIRALGGYISGAISRAAGSCRVDVYAVPDVPGPVGSPTATQDFTLIAASSATNLPEEVAVCASFHGDLAGVPEEAGLDRPRARRRGRIFVGPLNILAADTGIPSPRPSANFLGDLSIEFPSALLGAAIHVGVFSREDWAWRIMTAGYVDNAFDTQRRRGPVPSARTTMA